MLSCILLLALGQAPASPGPERAPDRHDGMPVGAGTKAPNVTLSAPSGGWSVGRMLLVEGSVSDPTINPVVLTINGDRYLMRTQGGRFARKFPAAFGKNVVTVLGTNAGGTGKAQVTTYAQIPPVPLKVILTSDTDGVYTDLHVYEPTKDSVVNGHIEISRLAHVYWAYTVSPSGGTFFLNEQGDSFDQPGYGPYLYVHRAPPEGVYAIATNYWPSGDKAHTVAMLNVTLFEGTANEIRRRVRVPLATQGTTKVLAWINLLGEDRALVYVPGQDRQPKGAPWPDALDTAAEVLAANKEGEGGD